jgi:hypothetical protein
MWRRNGHFSNLSLNMRISVSVGLSSDNGLVGDIEYVSGRLL